MASLLRNFITSSVFFVTLLLALLPHVVPCDDKQDCFTDAIDHDGDWVKCDLCVCSNFDDYTDDSNACSATDENLYNCWLYCVFECVL